MSDGRQPPTEGLERALAKDERHPLDARFAEQVVSRRPERDVGRCLDRETERPRADRRRADRLRTYLVRYLQRGPVGRREQIELVLPTPTPHRPDRVDDPSSGKRVGGGRNG